MTYDIDKMHNQNAPGCSDCQVVTAVNAYTYLTGNEIKQDSERYQNMVDLVCARHGAAIAIEKAHEELGIRVKKEYSIFHEWVEDGRKFPAELNVWHKKPGFHSTCLVDYEERSKAYRLLGLRWETTYGHWVFGEDLYQWIRKFNGPFEVRTFELNK